MADLNGSKQWAAQSHKVVCVVTSIIGQIN